MNHPVFSGSVRPWVRSGPGDFLQVRFHSDAFAGNSTALHQSLHHREGPRENIGIRAMILGNGQAVFKGKVDGN